MKKFLLGTVCLLALGMGAPPRLPIWRSRHAACAGSGSDLRLDRLLHRRNGGWGQSNSCVNFDVFGVDFADGSAHGPAVLSAARSATVGRPTNGCLAWKPRAIGRISATRASACSILRSPRAPDRWHRPLYRPDRLRLESSAVLRKGRCGGDNNRFTIRDDLFLVDLASASATRWGGTVGAGFEYGFAPNWSFGVEYNHLFMGDANNSFTGLPLFAANFANSRITQDVDMVTLRSTTASAVTGRRSQRDTDLAQLHSLQYSRPAEVPAFLLEGTCLGNPSGPRTARDQTNSKPLPIA